MPGRDLPDLEERLRRLPAALAVEAPAGLAERIARQGGRRRRLRRVTAAAVAVAVLGVAIATRSALLDSTPTPVLNPGLLVRNATPRQLARGQWQTLPSLPPGLLPRRNGAAVVWTGQELIIWGGVNVRGTVLESLADGAAYNPRTRRWTPLPPAPESQWLEGDHGLAVWTGREVLVWGGVTFPDPVGAPGSARLADGVAYDPQRRTWRRLPARTAQPTPSCGDCWAVWTGRELVVGQVEEADGGGGTVAVAYDPAADRWRQLPPSPTLTGGNGHLRARTATWVGTRLLVWSFWSSTARGPFDETGATGRPDERPDGIDLWAYDPATDRWTVLPEPPGQVRRGGGRLRDGVDRAGGGHRSGADGGRYRPDRRDHPRRPLRPERRPLDPDRPAAHPQRQRDPGLGRRGGRRAQQERRLRPGHGRLATPARPAGTRGPLAVPLVGRRARAAADRGAPNRRHRGPPAGAGQAMSR